MTRLRWRAIARALGVPRSWIALQAAVDRHRHKTFGNYRRPRDTLEALREWAEGFEPDEPQTVTISLGPDGLRIEER